MKPNLLYYNHQKKGNKKMKFWIDFEGYCSIEAENQEEAEQKFWNSYSNKNLIDEWLEITDIEKDE